jgi:hypothetical protein
MDERGTTVHFRTRPLSAKEEKKITGLPKYIESRPRLPTLIIHHLPKESRPFSPTTTQQSNQQPILPAVGPSDDEILV